MLTRLNASQPELPAAHFNLGIAYSRLAQTGGQNDGQKKALFTQSAAASAQAVKLRPQWAEAHNNLGFALGSLGRFKEAIPEHVEALRLKPIFPAALFNLAYAYRRSGDKKRAAETYNKLKEMNPPLANALYPLIK